MSRPRSFYIRIGFAGWIAASLFVSASEAQITSWTAPASGYVHDSPARTIRPVAGFVGSAVLGPAILDEVDWVCFAPNQRSALVRRNGSLLWIPDLAAPDQTQTLTGIPLPRQAFWSADASRAVLLTNDAGLVWLANFSAGAVPTTEASQSLQDLAPAATHGARARWSVLAVDSSADRVLLGTSSASGSQLWMTSKTLPPLPVPFSGHPAAAVFVKGAATAFVADSAAHQIVRIAGLDGAPVTDAVLTSGEYVREPAGIALSEDNARIFLADRGTTTIRIFDASSGMLMNELSADLAPLSLTPVGASRFLLNTDSFGTQPLVFLDTASPARVSFVPRGN